MYKNTYKNMYKRGREGEDFFWEKEGKLFVKEGEKEIDERERKRI